jgi:CysZ protein
MILNDFLKALGQITDSRFMGVLAIGLGLTIALLVGFYVVFVTVIGWVVPESFTLPWIGEITWVDNALTWAGVPLMLLLSSVLMVPVASAFISMFLETIAAAVERKHYPNLPPARSIGFVEGLVDALKFLGVLIVVNLLALVLYLIFTPLAPILFWVVNGILLGREYAQLVALRRSDAGRGRRVPQTSPAHDLRRRRTDGRAPDDPGGEPAGPDPRRGHLHPSLPPPQSGGGEPSPKRVNRSISSIVTAPLRMTAAITAQMPKAMPEVSRNRRPSCGLSGAEPWVPFTRSPASSWLTTLVCSTISSVRNQMIA